MNHHRTRFFIRALSALCLVGAAGQAHAINKNIGDADGFGFDVDGTLCLVSANGLPADTNRDGRLWPREYLPDLDGDGVVSSGSEDSFDHRQVQDGAYTDRSLSSDTAMLTFTFKFKVPEVGAPDHGKSHVVRLVIADHDANKTMEADGHPLLLPKQGRHRDGLIQKAEVAIPWQDMLDGEVVVSVDNRDPYFAIDYLKLALDADGDLIPDVSDNCPNFRSAERLDTDEDGIGDACDPCPHEPDETCQPGCSEPGCEL